MGGVRLILVRHGQTSSNLIHALDTAAPGAPLTELGEQQAAALVEAVADEPIEAIYVSVLLRTQQTAAPLAAARGLTPLIREGIREIPAGELEMSCERSDGQLYMKVAFAWADGDLAPTVPGGPTGREVLESFDAVVAEAENSLSRPDATVLMVSHGAISRAWIAARASNVDTAFAGAHPLSNTGIVVLDGSVSPDGGSWQVESWEGEPVLGPDAEDQQDPTGAAL